MKKLLKWGCFSFIGIFLLLLIIGLLTDSDLDKEIESPEAKKEIVETVPEKTLLNDSIWNSIVPSNFRAEKDEFKKTAFYYHKLTPKYTNRNWLFPYIGRSENNVWLRFKMQYEAGDWLFIDKVQFLVDGDVLNYADGNFQRDNEGGRIWEWGDLEADPASILMLSRLADSKEAKVRYTGRQYHNDRTITSSEKKAIKETLELYYKAKEFRFQ